MARDARDATSQGTAVPTQPGRTSHDGVDLAADLDLAGILARMTSDLERFESTIAIERGRIEHSMAFEQPGRHSERISSSLTALIAELLQILTLLRRLRETDELYGQTPAPSGAGPQPSRQRRQSRG
jgi:hypothetical protein